MLTLLIQMVMANRSCTACFKSLSVFIITYSTWYNYSRKLDLASINNTRVTELYGKGSTTLATSGIGRQINKHTNMHNYR